MVRVRGLKYLQCPQVDLLWPALTHIKSALRVRDKKKKKKSALNPESKLIQKVAIQSTFHLIVFYFKMLVSKKQLLSGLDNVK